MTRHPREDVLVAWLESGRPHRVGRHVEACEACLERVEAASGLDGGLLIGLESASAPPPDLHARTTGGVQDRLAAEEALAAVLDLFAVPWRTAAALLDTEPMRAEPMRSGPIHTGSSGTGPIHTGPIHTGSIGTGSISTETTADEGPTETRSSDE